MISLSRYIFRLDRIHIQLAVMLCVYVREKGQNNKYHVYTHKNISNDRLYERPPHGVSKLRRGLGPNWRYIIIVFGRCRLKRDIRVSPYTVLGRIGPFSNV